ncbi:hypothetical protein HYFRA_00007002 [Hymenoscyphus fraxineus]|uniref:Uncharacterized protein n=1 Tax=Hymenoscyphus fraxineus TaxID=746836 RepID=A0A9N9KMJ3_9HELO|nr:hypothetical protein HYFRA_00007002 [Hymenoscyphus fraxineus]
MSPNPKSHIPKVEIGIPRRWGCTLKKTKRMEKTERGMGYRIVWYGIGKSRQVMKSEEWRRNEETKRRTDREKSNGVSCRVVSKKSGIRQKKRKTGVRIRVAERKED